MSLFTIRDLHINVQAESIEVFIVCQWLRILQRYSSIFNTLLFFKYVYASACVCVLDVPTSVSKKGRLHSLSPGPS